MGDLRSRRTGSCDCDRRNQLRVIHLGRRRSTSNSQDFSLELFSRARGTNCLFPAAYTGDVTPFKSASPNAPTKKGRTPLHYAAEFGPKKLIELLISKGAEINAMADCGAPLLYAAAKGKHEFVKVLLDHNADPNVISHDQFSPLLFSILAKSIECMKLLLKAGADPNICGSKGMTPLGFAASEGETEVIKCLLNAGADPNVTNNLGITPVEQAALSGNRRDVLILFPETSPVPTVPEWSVFGLFKHVCADGAREEKKRKSLELFLPQSQMEWRSSTKRDYFGAIQWYTEAIFINPTDAAVLSNQSLCWSRMNEGELPSWLLKMLKLVLH
ncbi:hypothetical protein SLE2022_246020 [Rubroshorea leprosula]